MSVFVYFLFFSSPSFPSLADHRSPSFRLSESTQLDNKVRRSFVLRPFRLDLTRSLSSVSFAFLQSTYRTCF